jgi:hypothetical protein
MKTEVSLRQKPYGAEETGGTSKDIFEAFKSSRATPLTKRFLLKFSIHSQNSK